MQFLGFQILLAGAAKYFSQSPSEMCIYVLCKTAENGFLPVQSEFSHNLQKTLNSSWTIIFTLENSTENVNVKQWTIILPQRPF